MIRVISFDPGEKNFAVAVSEHVVQAVVGVHHARVVYSALVKNTIQNLKRNQFLRAQSLAFTEEINGLFDRYEPFDEVVVERFMGRGIRVGTTSETTNIMIGIIASIVWHRYGTPFPTLVSAATWKNEYNRLRYSAGLNSDYALCATTPHQLDAALIGHYRAAELLGVRAFESFNDEALRDRYMWWVERASVEPLSRRRKSRTFFPIERR